MSFSVYNSNTPLNFFERNNFSAERTIIDNQVHDIIKYYGMTVYYISQKKNYAIKPDKNLPSDYQLLFHAYGDIIKPEFNLPFLTRSYIQFENDIFSFNQFGLSNDLSITAFFNKLDFSFDAALQLADLKTINRKFKFTSKIKLTKPDFKISFKDKEISFDVKIPFDFDESRLNRRVKAELLNFEINPIELNEFLYATFHKRYSANSYIHEYKINVSYSLNNISKSMNSADIEGSINCSFVIKDVFKSYSENERRITPAVGDILLVQTVDNKFEKLEITEVVAENKIADGINPLLATYSYQCYCKPFIADNASKVGEIDGPTELNAHKLDTIEKLSQNASMTAGEISRYDHKYNDIDGEKYQQDDVYGGYDAELALNSKIVNVKMKGNQVPWNYFTWDEAFKSSKIEINHNKNKFIFAFDELYFYLLNWFDRKHIENVKKKNKEISNLEIDYSMFDISEEPFVLALNGKFYLKNNRGFLEKYYFLEEAKERLSEFADANPEFVNFVNSSYNKGFKSSDKLALLHQDLEELYKELLESKKPSNLVQIIGEKYEVEELDEEIEDSEKSDEEKEITFIKTDSNYKLIVDLRDVEQSNIDTDKFNELLLKNNEFLNVSVPTKSEINVEIIVGDLLTIYEFGDEQDSRLATNGFKLFVETHDIEGNKVRRVLNDFVSYNIDEEEYGIYNDKTIVLDSNLNWISADMYGIYFNPVKGDKILLAGDASKFHTLNKKSRLKFETSINSKPLSQIITFSGSKYYLKLSNELEEIGEFEDFKQIIYIPDLLSI